MLLTTPQRDFPVLDQSSRVIGILDREAMLAGLRNHGAEAAISGVINTHLQPLEICVKTMLATETDLE